MINSNHKPSDLSFQLSYGVGGGVEGVVYTTINFFLMFYLTVIVGLSPSLAGIIMLISLVIDGMTDPIIGSFSDNSRSPRGRRHVFMLYAIFPLCISLGLLFSIPYGLDGSIVVLYALLSNISLRLFLGVYAIPYQALSAELWSDYSVRSRISLYKCFFFSFATIGTLYMGFSFFFSSPEGISDASAYPLFGWVAALLTLFFGLFCWGTTHLHKEGFDIAEGVTGFSVKRFLLEFVELSKNNAFSRAILGMLIAQTGTGVMFNLNLLTLSYFWGLSTESIERVTLAFPIGFFLGVPVAKLIISRVEKHTCIIASNLALALIYSMLAFLGTSGFLAVPSDLASRLLVAAMGLIGLVSMSFTVSFFALIPDIVDEHELLFSARKEGVFFAVVILSAKVAAGLGAVFAGFGLDLIGFSNDLTTAAAFPEDVAMRMALLWGLVPAAFCVTSIILFCGYRISKQKHSEILEKLALRRATSQA